MDKYVNVRDISLASSIFFFLPKFPFKLCTDVLRSESPFFPSCHPSIWLVWLVSVLLLPALSTLSCPKSVTLMILGFKNNGPCIMFCLSLDYLHLGG